MGWSNTQVLVRFMLLQVVGTPILLVLLLKIRWFWSDRKWGRSGPWTTKGQS